MKNRPNVINLGNGVHRLDLRGKPFRHILQTVSNGKKTLDFQTKAAAERKADEIENLLAKYGSKKLETLESVMRVDPVQLQQRLDPFGKTVADAVEFYCKHLQEQREKENSQTLGTLMDEWLAEKKKRVAQRTMRKDSYDTLYYKANAENGYKAQWGIRPIGTIAKAEIEKWVEGLKIRNGNDASQVSKQHQISYLSQFFIWCKGKYGVPRDNPCETIHININDDSGEVEYYSLEEAKAIFELATSTGFVSLIPYLSICMFSGVRAGECERLTWQDIDFEDNSIVLKKWNSKTAGRRPAMQPNLVAWLKWFKESLSAFPLIPRSGFDDRMRQFKKALTVKWIRNGLRHSAATYTLGARIGDYAYLELHFGNSRTMLQKHYLSYPSKEVSLRFWNIHPSTILAPRTPHQ